MEMLGCLGNVQLSRACPKVSEDPELHHTVTIRQATAGDKAFLFGLAPRLYSVPRPSWHTLDTMKVFQERFMASTFEEAAPGALTLLAVTAEDRALGYVHLIQDAMG